MITTDEVRHIAKLAKIKLTDSDVEKFTGQLGGILDFFAQLQGVNTDNVAETSQVTDLENVYRKDEIEITENIELYLKESPHEIEDNMIKIPKIM